MKFWNHAAGEPWAITEAALNNILTIASRQNESIEVVSAKLGRELDTSYVTEIREASGCANFLSCKFVIYFPLQSGERIEPFQYSNLALSFLFVLELFVRALLPNLSLGWHIHLQELKALNNILTIASRQNESIEVVSAKLGRELDNSYVTEIREGAAVIPVVGPLFRYANIFTAISGASSYEVLAKDFRAWTFLKQ
jgi:hypothetical protein